ncbi:Ig-like domain-containing protein [Neorhodopirellula pilleata]|uniref:Dockerin type I repeat protein n=1 Tax=Neorhodopirellula pilleata TaxID=2714738 RepID=A0A5C6AV53_9BACT|nr:Ig-like domain-containing protein [Neorhodopirellula pilleata]TWU03089.1 Dockerin type I repeat protein [Neorhodopirellula pilleata]
MKNLRHLLRRVRPLKSRQAREDRSRGPRNSKRRLLSENLENRQLLAGDLGMVSSEPAADVYQDVDDYSIAHNYWNAYDVDNSGEVTALDALRIINYLNESPEGEMTSESVQFVGFVDVNEDHVVTALDALMVINELNSVGEAEAGNFVVEFEISARNLDDSLLPTAGTYESVGGATSPIYSVDVGDVFKIEVAVQDNRGFDAFGVFQSVVDLVVSQSGAIAPAVGEIQGAQLPRTVLSSASASGTIELYYEGNRAGGITSTVGDFFGTSNTTAENSIRNAIIQLNPNVDSVDDILVDGGTSSTTSPYTFTVEYNSPDLILEDVPRLVTVLTIGGVEQTVTIIEENVFENGEFNPDVLVSRYETFMRNHPTRAGENNGFGPKVYGQNRNIGSFDQNVNGTDIFDEVGTLGPIGNLQNIIDPFNSDIAYDSFSIPVVALAPGQGVTVRAEVASPRTGAGGTTAFEGVLIYGTEGGKEGVPANDIRFDEDAQFRLNIAGAQTGITAQNASLTVVEDDVDGETRQLVVNASTTTDTITYSIPNRTGALGAASIDSNGLFTYVPNANAFGTDLVVYNAATPTDGAATATVTVTITPQNDAPVANDDAPTGNAIVGGTPLLINVLANDDAGGGNEPLSELTISLPTTAGNVLPTRGTVTVVNDAQVGPRIQYTPNAGATTGTDTFTYTITDAGGLSDTATVTVNVVNNSTGVTALDKNGVEIQEDAAETLVADLSADNLIVVNSGVDPVTLDNATVSAASGTVRIEGDQIFFTPALNFNGAAAITYTASNEIGSDTGVINVTVNAVNDLPVAPSMNFVLNERATRTLNILQPGEGNTAPSDVETPTANLTIELPAQTIDSRAQVSLVNNQIQVTSTAAAGMGDFSFQYRVRDANGGTTNGVINIDVQDVQDPPIAGDGTATGNEDGPNVTVDLGNLTTLEGADTATYTIESVTPTTLGTATINGDNLIFDSADNQSGTATVVYRATGTNGFDLGTIAITINPVNDAPTLPATINRTVVEDGFIDIDVVALASDVDGDTLTANVATNPTNGTATRQSNGQIRYTPNADYNGPDAFNVTVTDGNGGSVTRTINITVTDVVAAPVANPGTLPATEDGGPVTLNLVPLVDLDPGDTATISLTTGPNNGSASITNGVLTYTPNANFNGTDTITYTATNASGSDSAVVTINVGSVNDAPIAQDDTATVVKNGSVAINVLANDNPDPTNEGDTPVVTVATGNLPANGTVTINNNVITYTPNSNFIGTDSFTYTLSDGAGGSDTATVTVEVLNFETSDIDGQLFQDSNNNGQRESSEVALGGLSVRLRSPGSANGSGQLVDRFTTTDPSGSYSFQDVPSGEYTLSYELPPGFSAGGDSGNGSITIDVAGGTAGNDSFNVDFDEIAPLTNGGRNIISVQPGDKGLPSSITASERSLFVFAEGEGGGLEQMIYRVGTGFEDVQLIELSLNSARDQALLTIVDSDDTLPLEQRVQTALVDSSQIRFSNNGTRVELFGGRDDFAFVNTINDASDFPGYQDAIDEILANL